MQKLRFLPLLTIVVLLASCEAIGTSGSGDMTTKEDSISYWVGTDYGNGLKQYGYDLNAEAFKQGYLDASEGKDMALTEEQIAMLSAEFQQELQTKAMEAQRKTNVADGSPAPDLTMATPDGGTLSISDLKGKYVLIDFWASWCKPCRVENPNVVALYNQYKDKGFEIVGVSLDDNREAWLQAIQDDKLTWKHMSDLKKWESSSVGVYGFQGIPYTVLIDPNGNIVAQHLRSAGLAMKLQEIFGS